MKKNTKNQRWSDFVKSLPEAAIPFFVFFSRFEFALKQCGCFEPDIEQAKPNWTSFREKLGEAFLDEVRKSGKAEKLLLCPPMTQVIKNDRISWNPAPKITNVQSLFEAILRTRNNLFHGGKFADAGWSDVTRDQKLLSEVRGILELALEKCPELNDAFYDHLVE